MVLLSPRPPDAAMRRLLKARPASRVIYIQGSALETRVRGAPRAGGGRGGKSEGCARIEGHT